MRLTQYQRFYQEGFEEGQAESTNASFREGKEYGLQTGFQKYLIIGQLKGILHAIDKGVGDDLSPQAIIQISQIKLLINQIKIDNEYGNVIETEKILVKIRNKLRVLTNALPSDKKDFNLQNIDFMGRLISGLEVEKSNKPSIGNLNDDGMW
ncbi:hypothetical protein WICMUC_000536 [Wickerhamomyces mucosus]|uniref:Essential protein Yae1 N-terminal domain-containing protein n=1 Tax=Wickerhamomyces mucosus TaxID=1378264 RepID=A0A9P8TIR2_9ASCO|nr:hypothetical protein WICMUC_000536 [Wickerhamomyces mucosus]